MSGFPQMLYRKGETTECHGLPCDTAIVNNEAEREAHYAKGWADTPAAAHGGGERKQAGAAKGQDAALKSELEKLKAQLAAAEMERDEALRMAADAENAARAGKASESGATKVKSGGGADLKEKK